MSELRTNRIVPRDGLPSGGYGGSIQVKTASATDNNTITSSSDTTMLTCVITPQRSDSILWIHVEYPSMRSFSTGNTRNLCNHHVKRNGTEIYSLIEVPQWRGANFQSSSVEISVPVSYSCFDSPNTTSAVTYTSTWAIATGPGFNNANSIRRMVIFEMAT